MPRQPRIFGSAIKDLRTIYKVAQERLATVASNSVDAGVSQGTLGIIRAYRASVDDELKWLQKQHAGWTSKWVPEIYAKQLKQTSSRIKSLGLPVPTETIGATGVHHEAVQILGNNLLVGLDGNAELMAKNGAQILEDSILSAAAVGRRDAPLAIQTAAQMATARAAGFEFTRNVSEQFRQGALEALTEGVIEGQGIPQIKRRMTELFRERGLPSFVDRAGKNWTLDAYAEMHARTALRETSNQAVMRGMMEVGLDIVIVIGTSTYPKSPCIPFEQGGAWGGRLSITGKTRGIPSVAEAHSRNFQHPNCIHVLDAAPDQEPLPISDDEARKAIEEDTTARFSQAGSSSA